MSVADAAETSGDVVLGLNAVRLVIYRARSRLHEGDVGALPTPRTMRAATPPAPRSKRGVVALARRHWEDLRRRQDMRRRSAVMRPSSRVTKAAGITYGEHLDPANLAAKFGVSTDFVLAPGLIAVHRLRGGTPPRRRDEPDSLQ